MGAKALSQVAVEYDDDLLGRNILTALHPSELGMHYIQLAAVKCSLRELSLPRLKEHVKSLPKWDLTSEHKHTMHTP